jgi:hypothetical protein
MNTIHSLAVDNPPNTISISIDAIELHAIFVALW